MTPEGSIGEFANLVVGLDVFLDGLTAVGTMSARARGRFIRKHDAMHKQRQLGDG